MTWSSSKGRGTKYGAAHQAERRAWLARTTEASPCVRCRHPLGPQQTRRNGRTVGLWHLDHTDDGTAYLGFSHGDVCRVCGRNCNVSAGSRKGARITNARRRAYGLGITAADL